MHLGDMRNSHHQVGSQLAFLPDSVGTGCVITTRTIPDTVVGSDTPGTPMTVLGFSRDHGSADFCSLAVIWAADHNKQVQIQSLISS